MTLTSTPRSFTTPAGAPPIGPEDPVIGYIDLDLDVTVRPNGCIELLDDDEFQEHQKLYGYPESVIERAEAAAREVACLARSGGFPFNEG